METESHLLCECENWYLPISGEIRVDCPTCGRAYERFAFAKDRRGNTVATRIEAYNGFMWVPYRPKFVLSEE